MPLPLDDFFRRITGQPMALPGAVAPSGPVTAPTPNAAAVAAPTMQQLQQQDFNNAALSRMGQLGMMLVAAGQRMTPRERATILAQAPQYMDGIQNDMQTAAQTRLMNLRSQQEQGEQERRAALAEKLKDPTFAQKLGISPEMLSTLGPQGAIDALKARAARDPVDEAYKLAQINHLSQPKWQITGQDEYGRPRYDLTGPNGEILTPPPGAGGGAPRGTIMDQLGNVQGMDALAKLKQLNPAIAAEVEGIVAARQPFPSRKLGTPEGAMLNSLVSLVDPNYNAATYDNRKKAMSDQISNQPNSAGGMRKNAEVGLRHFKALMDYSNSLPQNDWGMLSGAANAYDVYGMKRKADAGDQNAINAMNYLQTMEIGGDEMAKALGIASEGGREKIKELFDPALGRAAVQARIRNQIRLLGEKIGVQDEEYRNTMGPMSKSLIKPEIAEILKLGEDPKPTQAAPQQNNLPHGVRSIRRVN